MKFFQGRNWVAARSADPGKAFAGACGSFWSRGR